MRDPRMDPRPGDRFKKRESTATITGCSGEHLAFTFCGKLSDAPPMVAWYEPWLPSFRDWAKDAEVIQTAD
jgi:hypothetical protein